MGIIKYLKWLYTRWYLYVIALLWFLYTGGFNGINIRLFPELIIALLIGNLLLWSMVISICVVIRKLFSSSSPSRDNSKLTRK